MCVTAIVIGATAAVAGTVAAIDNANYQAGMMELQMEEQLEALRKQRKGLELQAMEQQLARIQEFEANRSANLAALAASGVGQNMGYLQGVEKAEERALKFDLTNIRLGIAGENNRISAQNRSIGYQGLINSANRKSAIVGSLLNLAATGASTAYSLGQTATPKLGSPTPTGTVTIDNSAGWRT